MSCNILDLFSKRHSFYNINNQINLSNKEIENIISKALDLYPSSFNSQESRIILLMGEHHTFFWNIVKEELFKVSDKSKTKDIENRINSFTQGYGTVLYFIDNTIVTNLENKYPLYAKNFSTWAEHGSAMLQYMIWTAFANNNVGASLQHYNPLIDNVIKDKFKIDDNWKLIAQMPFGGIVETPPPHEIIQTSNKLIIRP